MNNNTYDPLALYSCGSRKGSNSCNLKSSTTARKCQIINTSAYTAYIQW